MGDDIPFERSRSENLADAAVHVAGIVLAIGGLFLLLQLAERSSSIWPAVTSVIYGGTLFLCYVSSLLYNCTRHRQARLLMALDHCAIFLLIAGTYTPIATMVLEFHLGWALLAAIWTLAVTGIVLRLLSFHHFRRVALALYVSMGWLGLAWAGALLDALGIDGLSLLGLGGLAYTSGLIFFCWDRPFSLALWHLFVLLGSVCHFCAIAFYVLPLAA